MSDDERARELREEIAVHEAAGSVGYSSARRLPGEVRAGARYGQHYQRFGVSYAHSQAGALAEARAELAALEAKREPTIEERFPIGCLVRWWSEGKRSAVEFYVAGHLREYLVCRDGHRWSAIHAPMERLPDPTPDAIPVYAKDDTEARDYFDAVDKAEARYAEHVAKSKPAPRCEAPGWLGREHHVDATEYGTCRVCGASASDRKAARRRMFDAAVGTTSLSYAREDEWMAVVEYDEAEAYGPTRELAIEALFAMLEAGRKE